jgi:hypothetical protein
MAAKGNGLLREFTKALLSYSLAMSLFGLKQMQNLVTPTRHDETRGPASKALESVTNATTNQFGETLSSLFRTMDNLQRGIVGLTFSVLTPFSDRIGRDGSRAEQGRRGVVWSSEPDSPNENPVIRERGYEGDARYAEHEIHADGRKL